MSVETNSGEVYEIVTGIPTLALLPPKNYNFKVYESKYKFTIPLKGTYKELDPEFFSQEEGSFEIVSKDKNTIHVNEITKVLFAKHSYPDLKENQLFCPISFVVKDDNLEIYGQVLNMINVKENNE